VRVERILIVNLTRLGDLLQTSPTVAGLRAAHPDATITLVAEKNFAEVCESIPGVDEVYVLDLDRVGRLLLDGGERLHEAFVHVREVVHDLRARRFDLALNFSSSRMSAVFLGLLGVPDVRGWSMTPDGFRTILHPWAKLFAASCLNRRFASFNLVDCYRGVAGCLSHPTRSLLYRVGDEARSAITDRLRAAMPTADRPLVSLQLGASQPIRRWPSESFAALARTLVADGFDVALVGGPGERDLAESVRQASGGAAARIVDLSGRTSLAELAALLERSALLVTGDTGPMHLAAAVSTPIVGLFFGPALPFDTGPYGEDHVLAHARVACAPCEHSVRCLDPFCRGTIRPELIAAVVRARLAGDWDAIADAARGVAPVRLYRSGFDAHGLFECRPIGAVPPAHEDVVREAYRALWLTLLEGTPPPSLQGPEVDLAPFRALAALARAGGELSQRLERATRVEASSLDVVEEIGREIEALDRAIAEHGSVHPDVTLLTQMFAFEKESLPGAALDVLASETARLYRGLRQSTELIQAMLGRREVPEEWFDASLHQ